MKAPAAAAMPTFSWEGGTIGRVAVILGEVRPKDPLLVTGVGVADPSQAQDDIVLGN